VPSEETSTIRVGLEAVIAAALGGPQSATTSSLDGRVARRGTKPFPLPDRNEGGLDVAADDVVPFFGAGHGIGNAAYELVADLAA
jgi:hypothetical protein